MENELLNGSTSINDALLLFISGHIPDACIIMDQIHKIQMFLHLVKNNPIYMYLSTQHVDCITLNDGR